MLLTGPLEASLSVEGDAPAFSINREAGSGVEKCGHCVLGVAIRQDLQCPGPQPVLPILKMLHVF